MPELLQREKKELHRFPGLMERIPKASEITPPQQPSDPKPETETPAKKKGGRPRKNTVVDDTAPRKKGIDPKTAKVL